jgi:hypothetical protein
VSTNQTTQGPRVSNLRKFRHRDHSLYGGTCTPSSSRVDRYPFSSRRQSRRQYRHGRQTRRDAERPRQRDSGRSGGCYPRSSATRVLPAATPRTHEEDDVHRWGQLRPSHPAQRTNRCDRPGEESVRRHAQAQASHRVEDPTKKKDNGQGVRITPPREPILAKRRTQGKSSGWEGANLRSSQ